MDAQFIKVMGDQFQQIFTAAAVKDELVGMGTFLGFGTLYTVIFERRRFKFDMHSMKSFTAYVKSVIGYVLPRKLLFHPTQRANIFNYFVSKLYVPLLTATTTYAGLKLSVDVRDLLVHTIGAHAALLHNYWVVLTTQIIGIWLIWDLLGYCEHYAFHKIPLMWALHRVHHSSEVMTLFNGRIHPLEDLIGALTIPAYTAVSAGIVLYVTGTDMATSTMKIYTLLTTVTGYFTGILAHSHFSLGYGKLSRIFCGPDLHQIHHSAEDRHMDKNFGINLMVWDWLFGTLYVPQKGETYRFGLGDAEMGEKNPHLRIKDFYLEPLRYSAASIGSWWRSLSLVK